ncbi:MAG: ATP-binding protein, partial [Flavobacteriaceae bacterium]|nr:ATP-binding protein [Flavobacteriaceae bacterium]
TTRFEKSETVHYNAQMSVKHIRTFCKLSDTSMDLLKIAMEKIKISTAYDRILKVARTIVALEDASKTESHHISEAIQFRSLDREGWFG